MVFTHRSDYAKRMTTLFNKIHRLKGQPGWTWDHFLGEIEQRFPGGMDEKTLYSHYRLPHKRATTHVSQIIDQLHDDYFPDPFPESINGLMRLYNNLIRCKAHKSLERDVEELERFLVELLEREPASDLLRLARLHWLLGHIAFDRIPAHRDNSRKPQLQQEKRRAVAHYQQSVNAIERYNAQQPVQPVGESHLYKARHNILACYLNAVPQDLRHEDEEVLNYLRESSFLPASRITLGREPFQWSIARNGLRFSSLIHDREGVDFFFKAMSKVSPCFLDLNYAPLNHPPIAEGRDFAWAIEQVLTTEYLEQLKGNEEKRRRAE